MPSISNYKIVNKPTLIHKNGSFDLGGFEIEKTNTHSIGPSFTKTYKIKNIQIKEYPPIIHRRVQYINGGKIQNIFDSFNDNTNNNYDIEKLLNHTNIFTNRPLQIKVSEELENNTDGLGLIDVRKSLPIRFAKIKISKIMILRQRGFQMQNATNKFKIGDGRNKLRN